MKWRSLVPVLIVLQSFLLGASFPTYQGNSMRTGEVMRGATAPLAPLATYSAGSAIISSCSKAQNLFLFGSNVPALHALDGLTGSEKWKIPTNHFVYGAPTVEGELAYAGSLDHFLYVIDITTGALKAKVDLKGEIQSSPLLDGGNIYVTVSHPRNALVMLDKATLTEKKEVRLSQPVFSSPALFQNTLLVTPQDQKIYAFDKNTLNLLWEKEIQATTGFYTPAISDNQVFVVGADFNNKVLALDIATGAKKWETTLSSEVHLKASSPTVIGNQVYVVAGDSQVKLYALDKSSGALLWSKAVGLSTSYSFYAPPIGAGNTLFLPTSRSTFEVLDTAGNTLQSFNLTGASLGSPCGASGLFGMGDAAGTFHIFRVQNDTQPPSALILTPQEGATVGKNFTVQGTAEDNHFYKYLLELKNASGETLASVTAFDEKVNEVLGSLTTPASGNYTLSLKAYDVHNNMTSASVSITSDHTPPTLALTEPAEGALTNQTSLSLKGNTSGEKVFVNGTQVPLDSSGNFQYLLSLKEGENRVHVQAINRLGNSTEKSLTLYRDTQAPELTITSPSENFITNQGNIALKGKVTGGVRVAVNKQELSLSSDGSFETLLSLQEGENVFAIEAFDQAGNKTEKSLRGTKDSVAPFLELSSPRDGLITTLSPALVKGKTEPGGQLTIAGKSVTLDAGGNFSFELILQDGENTIIAIALDAAGNKTEKRVKVTFLSQQGPLSLIFPPDNLFTNQPEVTVKGTGYDLVSVTVNNTPVLLDSTGAFEAKVALQEGENTIVISGTLENGTRTSLSRKVTFDKTPPSGSISFEAGGFTGKQEVTLTLSGEDASGIKEVFLSEEANFTTKQVVPFSGKERKVAFTLSQGDGSKKVYARFFDQAGNSTDTSASIFLDTQPPVKFEISPDLPKPYLTGKREIVLFFQGADNAGGSGVQEIQVSEESSFTNPLSLPVTALPFTSSYTLSSKNGKKTVYARLLDKARNSLQSSFEITLDTAAAVLPLSEANGEIRTEDDTILRIEKGALKVKEKSEKQYLVLRTPEKELPPVNDPDIKPTNIAKELLVLDETGKELSVTFLKPVFLTLSLKNEKKFREQIQSFRIFSLTGSAWELLEGKQEISPEKEQVTALLPQPGIFRLMAILPSQADFIAELLNYPNPFSGSTGTTLSYKLKGDALEVKIEIYATSGQKLFDRVLFQGEKGTLIGRNRVKFSGKEEGAFHLPNGVYFYRVVVFTSDGLKQSKVGKMVILQ